MSYKEFTKRSSILLLVTLVIFTSRNVNRILNEHEKYEYNPFVDTKYQYDEKFYNRYSDFVQIEMSNYKQVNIFGQTFLITRKNK